MTFLTDFRLSSYYKAPFLKIFLHSHLSLAQAYLMELDHSILTVTGVDHVKPWLYVK